MYKKLTAIVLAGSLSFVGLTGCSPSENAATDESCETAIVNPLIEYENATDLENATGIRLSVPSQAKDVTYTSINSDFLVAEALFTFEGSPVTLRATRDQSVSVDELSGAYYTWTHPVPIQDNESAITSYEVKYSKDGTALASWSTEELLYCVLLESDEASTQIQPLMKAIGNEL